MHSWCLINDSLMVIIGGWEVQGDIGSTRWINPGVSDC